MNMLSWLLWNNYIRFLAFIINRSKCSVGLKEEICTKILVTKRRWDYYFRSRWNISGSYRTMWTHKHTHTHTQMSIYSLMHSFIFILTQPHFVFTSQYAHSHTSVHSFALISTYTLKYTLPYSQRHVTLTDMHTNRCISLRTEHTPSLTVLHNTHL